MLLFVIFTNNNVASEQLDADVSFGISFYVDNQGVNRCGGVYKVVVQLRVGQEQPGR